MQYFADITYIFLLYQRTCDYHSIVERQCGESPLDRIDVQLVGVSVSATDNLRSLLPLIEGGDIVNREYLVGLVGAMFLTLGALPANGDVSFGFAQGALSANATFSASGDLLTVILSNTATDDVANPGQVLTGLFFDIDGYVGELTAVSALLTDLSGTPVLFGAGLGNTGLGYNDYAGAGDIGVEAGYDRGAATLGPVGDHAIGTVGMGDFLGADDRFDMNDAHNIQGPLSPNGIEYGIVNSTYTGGGNAPINGPNALLVSPVLYSFSGFSGFSESDIGNVGFNYGTDFNPIPAPGSAVLGLLGFAAFGWVKRRLA